MPRYIDADELKNKILYDMAKAERDGTETQGYTDALFHLKTTPTADVVKVVRCKDCIHYRKMTRAIFCIRNGDEVFKDDYCSYGEEVERGDLNDQR